MPAVKKIRFVFVSLIFAICCVCSTQFTNGQAVEPKGATWSTTEMRDTFRNWLDAMKEAIEEEYYDPKYHGIDLSARFNAAKTSLKGLNYDWQMIQVLQQILLEFDDSHTYLVPPPRKDHFDYGFNTQIFGAECLITAVTKDSDADKAGLEIGDKAVKIKDVEP